LGGTVLYLGLDVVNGVGGLDLEGDDLSGETFDENLHRDGEQDGGSMDIVIQKSILELFAGEDEALLVVLVALTFYENLDATTEMENEMEGRLLLEIVIRKSAAILKLFAGKDEALLVGRNCPRSWP